MLGFQLKLQRNKVNTMPGIDLKNYTVYLKRLLALAKVLGIKVEFTSTSSEGIWMPAISKIKIDNELEESATIAALLHELGHSMDDSFRITYNEDSALYKAYDAFYNNRATKKHMRLVRKCEIMAWKNGRELAKRLKIPLGKWYDKDEKYCLNTYRN